MNKDRQIIGELYEFFKEKNNNGAVARVMQAMTDIRIDERQIGFSKRPNCKCTAEQVFQLLILFPFFSLKNANNYVGSVLGNMFSCHKDMFYRLLSNDSIDWRKAVYSIFRRLVARIEIRKDSKKSKMPVCAVIDDTDLPKTGKKTELLGRVYSIINNNKELNAVKKDYNLLELSA